MRFDEYYISEDINEKQERDYIDRTKHFIGVCDRIRQKEGGEDFWQNMMKHKEEISEEEFLKYVDPIEVLDLDETWEDFKMGHSDDSMKYFKSINNTYFFQTSGFEFIWKKE